MQADISTIPQSMPTFSDLETENSKYVRFNSNVFVVNVPECEMANCPVSYAI